MVPTTPKCVQGTPVQVPVWGLGRPRPLSRIPVLKVQAGEGTQPPAHPLPCKDWRPWASGAGRCGRLSGTHGCSEQAGSDEPGQPGGELGLGLQGGGSRRTAAGRTETGSPEMHLAALPMLRPWREGGRRGVDGLSFVHWGRTCTQPGGPVGGTGVSEGCACDSQRDRQMERPRQRRGWQPAPPCGRAR